MEELLAAGSGSLGGARPKASVRDGDQLMIAKFTHRSDAWDVLAWERTAPDLARGCGIDVPRCRLVALGRRHVLLLDRFDRRGAARVGYISAMTLLQSSDDAEGALEQLRANVRTFRLTPDRAAAVLELRRFAPALDRFHRVGA